MAAQLYLGAADVDVHAVVAHLKLSAEQVSVHTDGDAYADRVRAGGRVGTA